MSGLNAFCVENGALPLEGIGFKKIVSSKLLLRPTDIARDLSLSLSRSLSLPHDPSGNE